MGVFLFPRPRVCYRCFIYFTYLFLIASLLPESQLQQCAQHYEWHRGIGWY